MHYKHSLQNKSKSKPSGLMWQWILSYTSVLLMPILICSFYYFHSYNLVEQRTLSNQHLILENSKEQIDSAFYDAINLSNHLQLNSYINMLGPRQMCRGFHAGAGQALFVRGSENAAGIQRTDSAA